MIFWNESKDNNLNLKDKFTPQKMGRMIFKF